MSKAAQERAKAQAASKTLPTRENYSAKQVAMRLATDARTFRKFLRSSHSTFGAVGQGKRYDFTAEEFQAIRGEFIAWRKYSESRRTSNRVSPPKTKLENIVPIARVMDQAKEIYLNGHTPSFDELEGPSDEELMALEND